MTGNTDPADDLTRLENVRQEIRDEIAKRGWLADAIRQAFVDFQRLTNEAWGEDRHSLSIFSDEEYRTIALHRLGGLADVGQVRPIVPKPPRSEDYDPQKWGRTSCVAPSFARTQSRGGCCRLLNRKANRTSHTKPREAASGSR
jgi:hypothetical protein